MRKFILTIAIALMAVFNANAQTALEEAKLSDNVYVGVHAGASTPLTFNSVFPVNPGVGITIGKDLTPVFGLEIEGTALFNEAPSEKWTPTTVRAAEFGVNGTVNLINLLNGYRGTPYTFEMKTNTGIGMMHAWNTSSNFFMAKTGLDLVFNLGKKKAHSIVITPAIYWNLNGCSGPVKFDKRGAQAALILGYVYHFKTSNGTHSFKSYDVGAMINEIDRLNEELAVKPKEVVKEVVREVHTAPVVETHNVSDVYVFFAQGSADLDEVSKKALDGISESVAVEAYASPEGNKAFNKALSEKRAANVAKYLKARGVNVVSQDGLGVDGKTSGRYAKVKIVM